MPGGFINGGFNIGRTMFPVPFGAFSAAAVDYIKRLDSAGVRVARYDKANAALIDRLVGNGGNFWPASGAFNAMAGYLYPGNGANLIPLKDGHDAGTLNAFVTGDWNAVTGLIGRPASSTYVNSNRASNEDAQNDQAGGIYMSSIQSTASIIMGAGGGESGTTQIASNGTRHRCVGATTWSVTNAGYVGITRSTAANYLRRKNATNDTSANSSDGNIATETYVFARDNSGTAEFFTDARLPFYHIGPNLSGTGELAELDAALTEWKNALAAA